MQAQPQQQAQAQPAAGAAAAAGAPPPAQPALPQPAPQTPLRSGALLAPQGGAAGAPGLRSVRGAPHSGLGQDACALSWQAVRASWTAWACRQPLRHAAPCALLGKSRACLKPVTLALLCLRRKRWR